jgi:lysophospholipase L1-like esterase
MKTLTNLLVLILFFVFPFFLSAQTRVVCVGNSVTEGYGLANSATQAWPAQLGVLLGSKYTVYNCGVSGTTMLKRAGSPYWNTSRFNDAKNYNPDILIISLGTNDSHPNNWQYKNDFYNDYAAMIDAFRQNGRNPLIYVCYPVACYGDAAHISNLQNELIPLIAQVSRAKGVNIIDYNTPTQNQRNTLYNDNLHPNVAGATVIANTAFNTITPAVPAFFQNCNYGGYGAKLIPGDYNFAALSAKGIFDNDISSIKVPSGYKVFGYVNDNFTGNYVTLTADNNCLGGWDNLITSIRVRANGVAGKNGTYSLQNRNSGKYMDVAGGNAADGANILQWTGTGNTNQQFTLTDVGDGAYRVNNVATGKGVDVAGGSFNNAANVLQWTYGGAANQKFILIDAGGGFYKLKASHSGRLVEVYGGGMNAGDNIDQYDDNNQNNGQWKLAAPGSMQATTMAAVNPTSNFDKVDGITDNIITFYPNPVVDMITLKNVPANTAVLIYNLSAEVVFQTKSPNTKGDVNMNLGELKAGVYVINIGDVEKSTFKVLKE